VEPLCVYPEEDMYVILDGYLRYKVCLELGVESLPCYVLPDKEAYSPNHYATQLSPVQEARMLRKSLEKLDAPTLARTLGRKSIKHRLDQKFLKELHPSVVKAYDSGQVSKACSLELAFVKQPRQLEILEAMRKNDDFSSAYVRTQVLRTPANLCRKKRKVNPWAEGVRTKQELVKKLDQAEERYDFYSGLYRQYVSDLLKMCIYVRKILESKKVHDYLMANYAEMLDRFKTILFEADGRKAG
jgi:hypothetical protein